MKQIALKLQRLSPDAVITLAREIRDKITAGAEVFTNPAITMADLNNDITAMQTAQQDTLMGGKAATLVRNAKRKQLETDLKVLANYVENLALGDVEIITMAGMPLKSRGPIRYDSLAMPQGLKTETVRSGEVKLLWKKVHNAKTYEVEYCLDPVSDAGWTKAPYVSASRTAINGLTPLKEYWFRVRAFGSQGLTSDWTSPVKQAVL